MNTKASTLVAVTLGWLTSTHAFSEARIEFSESPHANGTKTIVTRDGKTVYEMIRMGPTEKPSVLYRFFWQSNVVATVLIVDGKASIEQAANCPVSYSIDLNEQQEPSMIAISDPDGNVIDGLIRMKRRLTPVDCQEIKDLKKTSQPAR